MLVSSIESGQSRWSESCTSWWKIEWALAIQLVIWIVVSMLLTTYASLCVNEFLHAGEKLSRLLPPTWSHCGYFTLTSLSTTLRVAHTLCSAAILARSRGRLATCIWMTSGCSRYRLCLMTYRQPDLSFFDSLQLQHQSWENLKQECQFVLHKNKWVLYYTMCTLTWDLLTYSSSIVQKVILVNLSNVWGSIDKLATKVFQPWAYRTFCDLASEVNWCRFHLHIMFGSRVIKNFNESQVDARSIACHIPWLRRPCFHFLPR